MTSPDPTSILNQINAARDQTYQNLALLQAQAKIATDAAEAAARDRVAVAAMSQQAVTVDTSVGTRVFAGDVMIFGDTGWRDVGADFAPYGWDWSGHERYGAYIRRIGLVTHLKVLGGFHPVAAHGSFLSPPLWQGFVPDGPNFRRYYTLGYAFPVGSGNLPVSTLSNGTQLQWVGTPPSDNRQTHIVLDWPSRDPWPASLPGTAIA